MSKIGLIVVDMIYDFTNPKGLIYYPKNKKILPKIIDLITYCKKYDCQIFYVKHSLTEEDYKNNVKKMRRCCIKDSGGDDLDERLPYNSNEDIVIEKKSYSAFFKTDLLKILQKKAIEQLIVVGTKTNNCVYATVLDAYNYNYPVYVVKDCVGTKDDLTNSIYLGDIQAYLGEVVSLENIKKMIKAGELK